MEFHKQIRRKEKNFKGQKSFSNPPVFRTCLSYELVNQIVIEREKRWEVQKSPIKHFTFQFSP